MVWLSDHLKTGQIFRFENGWPFCFYHSKTRLKFSASLYRFIQNNISLCIKGSMLIGHSKTRQICLVFEWSDIRMLETVQI
jgi:hypothetical protein